MNLFPKIYQSFENAIKNNFAIELDVRLQKIILG